MGCKNAKGGLRGTEGKGNYEDLLGRKKKTEKKSLDPGAEAQRWKNG